MTGLDEAPIISTPLGAVRGLWRTDTDGCRIATFHGIPYAQEPVGSRRFAAPVARSPWSGVRDCTTPGATPQRRAQPVSIVPEPCVPGEDTLNLTVTTPLVQSMPSFGEKKLPVLVWIHGGGYTAGCSSSPWYDGISFARDGIVTVSVSYRLGFEGFGWLDDAPANRGLLDQIEALRWVQRHIRCFGGDPNRVTVAGQSAGGGSVLGLLSSPAANGLFHAAICQSGAIKPISADRAREIGQEVATRCGVPATSEAMSSVDDEVLLTAVDEIGAAAMRQQEQFLARPGASPVSSVSSLVSSLFHGDGLLGLIMQPVLDGKVLDRPIESALAQRQQGIPLLMGTTSGELMPLGQQIVDKLMHGSAFPQGAGFPSSAASPSGAASPKAAVSSAGAVPPAAAAEPDLFALMCSMLRETPFGPYAEPYVAHCLRTAQLSAHRRTTAPMGQTWNAETSDTSLTEPAVGSAQRTAEVQAAVGAMLGQIATDAGFRLPTLAYATARGSQSTWMYDMRYPGVTGAATHCVELPFVFDLLNAPGVDAVLGANPPQALADRMHGDWVHFITQHRGTWDPWNTQDRACMVYDRVSEAAPGYEMETLLGTHLSSEASAQLVS
ncbi:carboxylesterase/lipase family protein [Devriesea agamarum]|uniref:carboxylesterase/lipase family protein n=1 Tax=Devriesea agamarum TaxID=472569 RepID=UPI00071D023E|nr:carboxylesterase family protein [Devriesea agamarum]